MVTAIAARCARETRVNALLEELAAHSREVRAHGLDVAVLSIGIAQSLGMDELRITRLARAALLHDVGKRHVPVEILQKPGRLTEAEWEIVRRHPMTGHRTLVDEGLVAEARIVLHHHERVDGGGYPTGRAGEDIPLESRILSVADSFDAMTSERPYRRAMSVDAAIDELRSHAGTQFDAACVEALAAQYLTAVA
jgi:HD-GYP domain-containing protein (c-di-GMP phosphodiesterase class II)